MEVEMEDEDMGPSGKEKGEGEEQEKGRFCREGRELPRDIGELKTDAGG